MRRAFSLLELLVVIAIIALLAGLLVPAIGLVRSQAKASTCAQYLRQIGLGVAAYATDNDGLVPDSAVTVAGLTTVRWSELIAEYVEVERFQKADGTGKVIYTRHSVLTGCPEWKATEAWQIGYGINERADRPNRPNATSCWNYPGVTAVMTHFALATISAAPARLLVADTEDYNVLPTTVSLNRHRNRFNAVFFDGHVQGLSGADQLSRVTDRPDLGLP